MFIQQNKLFILFYHSLEIQFELAIKKLLKGYKKLLNKMIKILSREEHAFLPRTYFYWFCLCVLRMGKIQPYSHLWEKFYIFIPNELQSELRKGLPNVLRQKLMNLYSQPRFYLLFEYVIVSSVTPFMGTKVRQKSTEKYFKSCKLHSTYHKSCFHSHIWLSEEITAL